MKLHSDIITGFQQIADAVPDGCYLAVFDHPGFGQTRCGYEGSRSHDRGFVVRLSGSSKFNMRGLSDKSATYEEWGWFLAELFAVDPDMKAGGYKNRDDFDTKTEGNFYRTPAA